VWTMSQTRIQIWIPLKKIPTVTAQEKGIGRRRNGKPVVFEKPEIKAVRALFEDTIGAALGYQKKRGVIHPDMPIRGPVQLITKWIWPADAKHPEETWKITKPDTDNSLKLLKDSITDLKIWKNDSQVASEITEKSYGYWSGIYVEVKKLDEGK
jgi:Holliday junction resolvase RusA-like endonuclease